MKLRGALLAASLLAFPAVAMAQPVTGLYVGAGVGVNLMQDEHVKVSRGGGTADFESRVGPAAVGSVGWGFGNGLRAELEGSFRANQFHGASGGATNSGGWEQKFGAMVNVLYDFNGMGPIAPYVGVGAGYQWAMEQDTRGSGGGGSVRLSNTTKGAFAYQAILGAAMPIAAAPGLAITAEYRFMGLAGDRTYSATSSPPPTAVSAKMDNDFNHTFLLGIRYNFGQSAQVMAASAAAPAAAVTPARSYLVFFDWDKSTLTDRARQIIREAAENSTHVQYTRIEVNGYADTSGTHQYNIGLSIRRANSVKAELVKDGVPANAITTQGFGDTHLLVPTGPGVREPQNRRVEIIIR